VVLTSQRNSRELFPRVRRWLRVTDRLSDGVVVNCEAVRREMLEQERTPAAKVFLCYNGLDTSHIPAREWEGASVAEAPQTVTIGVICAFRPVKDLLTLVDAFHRIRDIRPGLRLVMVGEGPLREPVERRIRALNLDDQCRLEPATHDVPGWLRRMDIFVLPSRSEGLSNALMEAMAAGCAPVASRVGGNPELLDGERTGLLFQPGNDADLAECLLRLVLDDALRRSIAQAASDRVRRDFTLRAAADRLAGIYDERLAARGR
jgi:glycosyltransferase involved in cell wall biosynthesis